MKKDLALISSTVLAGLVGLPILAHSSGLLAKKSPMLTVNVWAAAPQAADAKKQPQWKSTDEYNAFQAMAKETDPNKKISLAEAFLAKFTTTDFKDLVYVQEMAAYQQSNNGAKAIDAGEKALQANPDNMDALRFVSFAFPFVYNASEPDAATKLSQVEGQAKHGLEVLQGLQKPANVPEDKFNQAIKGLRSVFNGTVGFAALQRKDYAGAITSLKTAIEDDPSNNLSFYWVGQAYLYSTPPDFDNAIWNLARSVALANASPGGSNAAALQKFYDQVYVGRHGSDQGEKEIVTQAATSVNPPAGFKVAPPEKHKSTGNQAVDAYYAIMDSLRVGGDQEKQAWDQYKGQPFGYAGAVVSAQPGTDADTTMVQIAFTDESKAKDGAFDLVLADKQPDAKLLAKGDLVHFQGTLSAYTLTPSFSLTLDGTIPDEDLAAAKERGKAKAKPKPRPRTQHPTTHHKKTGGK